MDCQKLINCQKCDEMPNEALDLASVGLRNSLGWQLWKDLDQAEKAVAVYQRNIEESGDWIAHYNSMIQWGMRRKL